MRRPGGARLAVVAALLDDLGRHPVRRADERVALGHGGRQLRGHAKVRQLHRAALAQQDVAALDVAVHLAAPTQAPQ